MMPDATIKGSRRTDGEPERIGEHLAECAPCRQWIRELEIRTAAAVRCGRPWIGTIGEWLTACAIIAIGWFLAMAASIILQD